MHLGSRSRIHQSLLLGLSILFLHFAALGQQDLGNIIGEVRINRVGLPSKQILINLQIREATINTTYADDSGRFGFYALPGGIYNLIVEDDDYLPEKVQAVVNPLVSQQTFVPITLTRKTSAANNSSQPRLPGGNPNVVDLRDYTRRFPKKAVKEYEKGLEAEKHSDNKNAVEHYQRCLDMSPDFYPAHNELGSLFVAKSDFDAARKEFEEVLRLNPSDAKAALNLANVYLLTKRYDEAFKNVQNGLRRDPNSAFGHFILGSLYERSGKHSEAERTLRHALELDPTMSKVHLELVNLYLSQRNNTQAAAELRAFLKAFPRDPLAPKAKQVLTRIER